MQPLRSGATALTASAGLRALGMGLIAPVLPRYAESFGAGATLIGLLLAGLGLSRLLVSLPTAWLTPRLDRRRLLLTGPAATAPLAALCAITGSFWLLALFCLAEGAAAGIFATAALSTVLDRAEADRRGRSVSTFQLAGLLGASAGPALGGLVAQQFGNRMPFLLYAALATAVAWWLRRPLQGPRAGPMTAAPAAAPVRGTLRLLSRPGLIGLWLVAFSLAFVRVGTQLSAAPFLGAWRLSLNPQEIGLALSAAGLATAATYWPAGWLSDRYGRSGVVLAGGLAILAGLLLLVLSVDARSFLAALVLLGTGLGLAGPGPVTALSDVLTDADRNLGVGIQRTLGDAGAALSPVFFGWLIDRGEYGAAFVAAGALVLLALVAFARASPDALAQTARAPPSLGPDSS